MAVLGVTSLLDRLRRAAAPPVRAPDPPRPLVEGTFAARTWLPNGRKCAVVFTIDDVHPAKSTDTYEAGGDLEKGALRHVAWLLERHPELHVTLFVTPDWRQISPFPTRKLLARIPVLRDRLPLARTLPKRVVFGVSLSAGFGVVPTKVGAVSPAITRGNCAGASSSGEP